MEGRNTAHKTGRRQGPQKNKADHHPASRQKPDSGRRRHRSYRSQAQTEGVARVQPMAVCSVNLLPLSSFTLSPPPPAAYSFALFLVRHQTLYRPA